MAWWLLNARQLGSAALYMAGGLAASPAAAKMAGHVIGNVDSLTAGHAEGWACLPGTAGPVNVAVYAGTTLLGIYPATVSRADVASSCGGVSTHGFEITFDPATLAQFTGQASLSVAAIAAGLTVLLPASTRLASNPFPLPMGSLSGVDSAGAVQGALASGQTRSPRIAILMGGPLGQGGMPIGTGLAVPNGVSFADFAVAGALPDLSALDDARGGTLPLWGYADDGAGNAVPLAAPIALTAPAQRGTTVSLAAIVAQNGSRSGITTTLFTQWLPAGSAFTTLTGSVSLAGNNPDFAEALVLIGITGDKQAACLANNDTWPSTLPAVPRLWAAILKNTGMGVATVPVNFALPAGVSLPGAGSGLCLTMVVSAGYPFLDRKTSRYTRTTVNLTAGFEAVPPSFVSVAPLGLGGEFRFDTAAGPGAYTYIGISATRRLVVDGIAGSVSASAVAGAPATSLWQPVPVGPWGIGTSFVYLPAAACQAAGFHVQPSNGIYSVLRRGTPAPFAFPAGTRTVASFPLAGSDTLAVQRSAFWGFAGPSPLTLAPGDCLLSFQHSTTPATASSGPVDYEGQSTVFVRLAL